MFKAREDRYLAKTFETQEAAMDYIKTVATELKKDGFTVMNMNVRELFGAYTPMMNGPSEAEPEGYVGSVEAKKEAPPSNDGEDEASTPAVN